MNKKQISAFEKLEAQLRGLYDEMQTLVKKSPNDGVNKFKLRLVNAVLRGSNDLLTVAQRPFPDFTEFDENELPSNSDVLIILSQYLSCLEKMRAENIDSDSFHRWYWVINGERSDIRTGPPRKLAK